MRVLAVVALVACTAPNAKPVAPRTPVAPRHVRTPLEQARAYELGEGVARDYAAAAAIYAQQCTDGTGDLEACRHLLRAGFEARGVDEDRAKGLALATVMCERRDDAESCAVTAMATREPPPHAVAVIERMLAMPCDAQHVGRCELPRDPFRWFNQSSSVEAADNEFDTQGCALGVLEACGRLRYAHEPERTAALATLGNACDRGDAVACEVVDRPIDAALRCAAHDFAACGLVGCAGDEASAELAATHHVTLRCDRDLTRSGVKPVATGITPAARPPFDAIEFRQLRGDRLRFEIYNTGTHPIALANGAVYAYDDAGQQLGREPFELRYHPLAPGEGTTLVLHHTEGATFEPCVDAIGFADELDHYHVARCPLKKAKGVRWGDGRDNLELRIDLPGIPLADDWTGTLEPVLAEPFEQSHPGIRVRAAGGWVFLAPSVYAAADVARLTAERGPQLELPLVREPTTIAYSVRGIAALNLSPITLAKIFQRGITRWDDPAIARDNPKRALPATPIVVLQETIGADEQRVTTYLARAARGVWKIPAGATTPFFPDVRWVRSYDLAKELAETDGAIAYAGAGLAEAAGLGVAWLRGEGGRFVPPSGPGYPLVDTRTLYLQAAQPDRATADAVRAYVAWLLTDAQPIFDRLGYLRLPDAVLRASRARLDGITVKK